jgi:hypothetical protein
MRLTKLGIAQLLISRLFPNPTNDKKLTEPQAMLLVAQARDFLLKRSVYQTWQDDKTIHGEWLSVYKGLELSVDEQCGDVYLNLPARTVSIFDDIGIYQVWKGKDESELILPIRAGQSWLMQEFSGTTNLPTYYLEQDKLIFQNLDPKGCKISIRMIATAEDIAPNDYFPFDGSMLGELIDICVQRYGITKQIPQDINNNNVSE